MPVQAVGTWHETHQRVFANPRNHHCVDSDRSIDQSEPVLPSELYTRINENWMEYRRYIGVFYSFCHWQTTSRYTTRIGRLARQFHSWSCFVLLRMVRTPYRATYIFTYLCFWRAIVEWLARCARWRPHGTAWCALGSAVHTHTCHTGYWWLHCPAWWECQCSVDA